jgi:hypothetical protein
MYRCDEQDWGWREPRPTRKAPARGAGNTNYRDLEDEPRVLVHPLVWCPPLPKGTRYVLVQRTWPGQRTVLATGRARSRHESLNLARVRHTGATLGANEVHILAR